MPTVRTTMRPDDEIEVSEDEYLDLQRQGLLVDDNPATPETGAVRTPSRTRAADTQKE